MDHQKLTRNIVLGMTLGILLGSIIFSFGFSDDHLLMVYVVDGLLDIGGKVFVISLKLLVVPLVFVSLACGASNLGDSASMGRIGIKTIGLYLMTTAVAITLALLAATLINPGQGINLTSDAQFLANESPSLKQVIINIFPSNPILLTSKLI